MNRALVIDESFRFQVNLIFKDVESSYRQNEN